MRINGYRCDGCGKEHLLESYRMPEDYALGLPADWYIVWPAGRFTDNRLEPWVFCSKSCVREHPLRIEEENNP